ncbi:efflux transporter outer membrane subunit [Paraburkholderia sp. BR14262]|uniref:efflux transporter outer membrane subunit n=1 Tax=Paraburkholderia sp. BR14262 TaxID=3236999 RepID=UPI0034CE64CA
MLKTARWTAITACLTLGSCNFAPRYQQPDLPVAQSYESADIAAPGGERLASELTWETFFRDPALRQLIAMALAHNRDLAASVARIGQAQALYRVQRSAQFPQVAVGADATRTKTPLNSIEPELPNNNTSIHVNQYSVQVAVTSFELDFWGRVANQSEAARRNYLATVEANEAFRLSLISKLAATYYAILSGNEGIDLAQHTLQTRQYALEVARLRLEAGATSLVDYEQARILVTQAQTQLAELQRTTGQQRDQLAVLIGGPLPDAADMTQRHALADADQFGTLDAGLPSSLLALRPDIRAAEQSLRAADADIGAARADYFPRVSLTGNFGYVSPELSDLFVPGKQAWLISGFVALPIFDAGRRSAQVRLSEARQTELVANYQKAVQVAFREVSDALIARQRLQEQIAAQERAVASESRLAEAAELRYENGISIYLEVVDAKRSLFAAQQQLIQLRAAALQNGASLYVALGGGQDARPAEHAGAASGSVGTP